MGKPNWMEQSELAVELAAWFKQKGNGFLVIYADSRGVCVKHQEHYSIPEILNWKQVVEVMGLGETCGPRKSVSETVRRMVA